MKKRAFTFVILASILWGTSGLFVYALSPLGFTSAQMTFARGSVSFLCYIFRGKSSTNLHLSGINSLYFAPDYLRRPLG